MKEAFIDHQFRRKSQALIDTANEILDRYQSLGYRLTLRQLYYQFVTLNAVENSERSYKNLGDLVSKARQAGLIDWEMIEDRSRETVAVPHWGSPADIVEAAARSFRLDKWEEQPHHVEVMVEKQALEGILIPVCRELDIVFSANKGYTSTTVFKEAGDRLRDAFDAGKEGVVLYLGDHDPSGIDMTRDAIDRLTLFARQPICVKRLALNIDQVRLYQPPPNPAKEEDARFRSYKTQFGDVSWELDALDPAVLGDLVRNAVLELRDEVLWLEAVARENSMRDELQQYAADYRAREEDE